MRSVVQRVRHWGKRNQRDIEGVGDGVKEDTTARKVAVKPYGLLKLYEGPEPIVDIIVVHGLNGHREKTWTAHNDVLWLRDLLPNRILHSRILSWGYDADTYSSYTFKFSNGTTSRTPHQGGEGVAWGERALKIASIFVNSDTRILHHLERDSEWLQRQLEEYTPISDSFVTKFAYETYPTPTIARGSLLVVPKASAVVPGAMDAEPLAIMANHLEMVKYPDEDDDGYQRISGHLSLMAQKATIAIRGNWLREDQSQMIIANPLNVQYLETDYIKLIDTLNFSDDGAREKGLPPAWPGTVKWILNNDKFNEWTKSNSGLFWLNGKPGSGKSTITKHILDVIRNQENVNLKVKFSVYLAFFFNHQGSDLEKTIPGLLRSLLLQLLKFDKTLFDQIAPDFLAANQGQGIPETLLVRFLKILLNSVASKANVVLLIDALDECRGSLRKHIGLLKELEESVEMSGFTIHIFVASRPVPATTAWLGRGLVLKLEENNMQDISSYVTAKTKRLVLATDASVYTGFVQNIVDRADGVFLWVVLVTEELLDGWETSDTIGQLSERLASIPPKLDEVFDRMLKKIPEAKVQDALAMFRCVLGARRPLTLLELQSAMAYGSHPFSSLAECYASGRLMAEEEAIERRIQSCCGGLLEVVARSSLRVQFIHQTVGEFLVNEDLSTPALLGLRKLAEETQHEHLFNACINYLSNSEMEQVPEGVKGSGDIQYWASRPSGSVKSKLHQCFPFLAYSLQYWVEHYIRAAAKAESHYDQLTSFFDNNHFLNWYRLYCYLYGEGWDGSTPPLISFAAEHNFLEFLKEYIAKRGFKDLDDGEFGGPLQAAVVHGNLEVVRLLLDNGADINAKGGRFGTGMAAAISLGQYHIIDLLKQRGADIELCAPLSPSISTTCPAGLDIGIRFLGGSQSSLHHLKIMRRGTWPRGILQLTTAQSMRTSKRRIRKTIFNTDHLNQKTHTRILLMNLHGK